VLATERLTFPMILGHRLFYGLEERKSKSAKTK
jgi:hypothetical protein